MTKNTEAVQGNPQTELYDLIEEIRVGQTPYEGYRILSNAIINLGVEAGRTGTVSHSDILEFVKIASR